VPSTQIRPKSLADYLDVLSRIAFEAGLSGRVVEAKWKRRREGSILRGVDGVTRTEASCLIQGAAAGMRSDER
jgi:hypothetical protein